MRIKELAQTYKKFGALYPILLDKRGNIIDGFSRKKVDENWPTITLQVDDETEKQKISLIANIIRREISGKEITERLDKLAELTGWIPKRLLMSWE